MSDFNFQVVQPEWNSSPTLWTCVVSDFNFQVVQPEWNSSLTLWTYFGLLKVFNLSGIVPSTLWTCIVSDFNFKVVQPET